MRLDNLLNNRLSSITQCLGAINTFGEMIEDRFNRLADFIADEAGVASVYIPQTATDALNLVCAITGDTYSEALANPLGTFELQTTDTGETVIVDGASITDAVASQLTELKVESEFISYCLRDNASADGFIGRVRDLYPTIESAAIMKFSKFLETGGSALEALRMWLATFTDSLFQKNEDEEIELVYVESYAGNVFLSAVTQITDTLASFFDGVWEGITHLDRFFHNLWDALVGAGQWLMNLAFGELLTDYEKTSNGIGLLDIPVFQFTLGVRFQVDSLISECWSDNNYSYYNDGWAHKSRLLGAGYKSMILDSLEHATTEVVSGTSYKRILDIPVPCNWAKNGSGHDLNDDDSPIGVDLTLRLGRDYFGQYVIQGFLTGDYATLTGMSSQFSDPGVYWAFNCLAYGALRHVAQVVPLFATRDNVSSAAYDAALLAADLVNASDSTAKLPDTLTGYWDYALNADSLTQSQKLAMAGIMLYMLIMGPGFYQKNNDGSYTDTTNTFLSMWYGPDSVYQPEAYETNVSAIDPIDITLFNKQVYKPYVRSNPYGVCTHYQNTTERASEVVSAVVKLLIAAAAVAVTVKYIKWRKAFQSKSTLLHANMDRLAWQVGESPTDANLAAYNAAFTQARKIDLLANLMGATINTVTTATTKMVSGIASTVGKVASNTNSLVSSAVTSETDNVIAEIRRLIVGNATL